MPIFIDLSFVQEIAWPPEHGVGAVQQEPDAGLQPCPSLGPKYTHCRLTGDFLEFANYRCLELSNYRCGHVHVPLDTN